MNIFYFAQRVMKLSDKLQVYILLGGIGLPAIFAASNQAVLAFKTSCYQFTKI